MILLVSLELIPSIFISCLSLLSMIGIGAFMLRFSLEQKSVLSRLESPIVSLALGMIVYSQILLFAAALGLLNYSLVMTLRIGGLFALAFAMYLNKPRLDVHAVPNASWLPVAIVGLLCGLMIVSTYLNTSIIHGDARQYHLAFPWLTSQSGQIVWNETLHHTGTYLGYDFLYLLVADLTGLIDSPAMMDQLKLFNAITNILLPVSVLLLCRAFGGSKTASAMAALAVFTLGPIGYWGVLKNDIFAAAIGVTALAILVRAYDQSNERLLFIATALAAYAVSVKLTNVVPLAIPFGFVYLSQRFTLRTCVLCTTMGLVLLLPWAITAYVASGNPFHPIAAQLPDEIKHAWVARNANGIEPSTLNFVTKFVPIVLGLYQISGNVTLGILSLAVLGASMIVLMKDVTRRKAGIPEVIAASALIWFAFFYASRYDNRFLSRYVMLSCAALFSFMSFKVETCLQSASNRSRVTIFLGGITLLLVLIVKNPGIDNSYKRIAEFHGSEQLRNEKKNRIDQYSAPYRVIEQLRKPGEAVAINDHMTLFLKPPFFNLHAMHAVNLNLYRKDAKYVRQYLADRSVKFLLFRKGISGGTKALDEYMADCAQELQAFGKSLILYTVKPSCK